MDLQDKISMGTALFGSSAIDRGASTTLAEVLSDAKDGEVTVYMRDENGNEQKVTIPCDGDLREGDTATIIIQEGTATAISASGAGERSKQETATAQETATTAKETAENAASAATTAKETAENAASAATTAKETAETAATNATKANNTARAAATKAQGAVEKIQKELERAIKAEQEITANVDNVKKTADQAVSDIAAEVTRAQDKEKEIEDLANTASDAASTAVSDAKDAASAAQAAGVSASLAQAAAEAAQGTADETKKYFYHDSEGAHVISGDLTDPTRLDLTNDSLTISEGGVAVSEFTTNKCTLNGGLYTVETTEDEGNGMRLVGTGFGTTYDWGADYKNKIVTSEEGTQFNYIKDGKESAIYLIGTYASITADENGNFSNYVQLGHLNADATLSTQIQGNNITIGTPSHTNEINLVGTSIKANGNNLALLAYPVGSIYMSVNSTSPATLFGGTWQQLQNRFLIGAGSSYTAGSTGGSTSHSHTVNSHSHTMSHTHTVNSHTHTLSSHTHSVASHTHTLSHTHTYGLRLGSYFNAFTSDVGSNKFSLYNGNSWTNSSTGSTDTANVPVISPVAAGTATTSKNIYRPSLTTTTSAASTSTTSGTSLTTGSAGSGNTGSASPSTGAASSSNTGTASPATNNASNLPPYLAVYMWRRTA